MKLRNKKTGEIIDTKRQVMAPIVIRTDVIEVDGYSSLAELIEEWEDYVPKEPLIKNDEIREIIRAWADVNDAGKLKYSYDENSLDIYRNTITFNRGLGLEDGHSYTIDELCGEVDEC